MTASVYAMDTLADWEIGHVTVELHSGRCFKVDAPEVCVKTVALAGAGLLNDRLHTSNGEGFLDMMCPGYKGQRHYVAAPSVANGNLITASGTAALLWAKQIIERLGVFRADTLEAWHAYFSTGEARYFFALMQSLPGREGR